MADDLLQGLKDAIDNEQNTESDPQATLEKLFKAIENMPGISEEDKKNMLQNLASGIFGNMASEEASQLPVGGAILNPWLEFATLFGLISLIVLALGLIGYKLYYNMVERERRRGLKKLQKEQKKKK